MNDQQQSTNINEVCVGVFTFVGILVAGYFLTAYVRDRMVDGLPRVEVYEAIGRDLLAFKYTLIGWMLTFVIAIGGTYSVIWFFACKERR